MKIIIVAIVLILSFAVIGNGLAGAQARNPGAKSLEKKGIHTSVTGKIDYMKALGGYFVRGEKPPTELIIVNPDKKLLEELYRSRKVVRVEGRLTQGADRIFIETIDGRQYQGKEANKKK